MSNKVKAIETICDLVIESASCDETFGLMNLLADGCRNHFLSQLHSWVALPEVKQSPALLSKVLRAKDFGDRLAPYPDNYTVKMQPFNYGYVYVIKHESKPIYKIGKTINPKNRINDFRIVLPYDITPICLIRTNEYHMLEYDLHSYCEYFRIRGEWFELPDDELKPIMAFSIPPYNTYIYDNVYSLAVQS